MLQQRLMLSSTRRLLHPPTTSLLLRRTLAPFSASSLKQNPRPIHTSLQKRSTATDDTPQPPPQTAPNSILATQRLHRPVSPHLSIYRPQITWYLSILNRITGATLSGGLYIFATAYLLSPLLGWHLESTSLALWFGDLHPWVKGGLKFGVAMPFVFHSLNGVRHLVWDSGRELKNKQVNWTGWAVVGGTVVGSGALATLW